MANANDKEKIFKSWAGIDEATLIKEVATKGEHVKLCIAYGARKHKLTTAEYELKFHDIVETYVNRLLKEHLICKADTVLRNVQRDVKCFFYEFACKCNDVELKEMIEDYLKKKEPEFEDQLVHLQFYNEFLKQLKGSELMKASARKHMKRLNLESLMNLDSATQQYLMIEMYFETRNASFLQHMNKDVMWDFLVETKKVDQIILWCRIQQNNCLTDSELEHKYSTWSIESEMYEYALHSLQNIKDEVLRNSFAAAGYFFNDERNQVETILQRICLTESYEQNFSNIESLNLGRYLFNKKYFHLLLENFVSNRQLMELSEENPENRDLQMFLIQLKTNQLDTLDGFDRINFYTTKFIQSANNCDDVEYTLPIFFEFLTNQPSISNLQCSIASGPLKAITYLKALQQHHHQQQNDNTDCLPSVNELLKNFKGIDFKRVKKYAKNYGSGIRMKNEKEYLNNGHLHRLNFVDYIKQSRSAYAIYLLLVDQLENYAQITRSHLVTICENVYDLALSTATAETEVLCHCVAFCEMLGLDTRILRCFLKMKKFLAIKNVLWTGGSKSLKSVILETESLLVQTLQREGDEILPFEEYNAVLAVKALLLTQSNLEKESTVLKYYASNDSFWRLLVLLHYFEIPIDNVSNLVKHFAARTMGEHMARALSQPTFVSEEISRGSRCSTKRLQKSKKYKKGDKCSVNTSIETITSSATSSKGATLITSGQLPKTNKFFVNIYNDVPDLFALILLNSSSTSKGKEIMSVTFFLEKILNRDAKNYEDTVINFLRTAIEQQLPIMAVLAASLEEDVNLAWCWIVWLAESTNQSNTLLRLATGNKIQEFPWNLIEHLVTQGQIRVVLRSFEIFYPNNPLVHLFRFLNFSMQNQFDDVCVSALRLYCLAWSNEDISIPLSPWITREKAMKNTIRLLLLHMQNNFVSDVDQLKFLNCICKAGLNDVSAQLDFNMLREFCDTLQMAAPSAGLQISLNFIQFLHLEQDLTKEYERVLDYVIESKEYDVAVLLASLLQKPISDIIYNKWVNELQTQLNQSANFDEFTFAFDCYEQEVSTHSLSPEILVNFLLYAGAHLPVCAYKSRYYVMQKALNVIKHHHLFPNESFDRDQIEYDMVVNYLMLHDNCDKTHSLTLYHSEYYEEIMVPERCVLYKSFHELRELAGIDDINISNKINLSEKQSKTLEDLLHRLLDDGDVVEALRLQELFDVRPLGLRLLVFCMALAESMSSIYNMSAQERQLHSEIERSNFSKFTKRTLSAAPSGSGGVYFSDSCTSLDFEEIPSKEKKETLSILQGIGSKLKYGVNLAKRIISCYRAAMYLDKEYIDVLRTKDVQILLQSIAEEGCMHRLLVVSDILTSTQMQPNEIAELLAFEIVTAVVRPRFYILSPDQQAKTPFRNADLWGYNIDRDFHLFLELTPDRTKLGACLLEYCDALKTYRKYQNNDPFSSNYYFERLSEIIDKYGLPANAGNNSNISSRDPPSSNANTVQLRSPQVLSHKKKNVIYVELLIKAHQSFIHECSMEGIANVLQRAKILNGVLARAKSWSIIVRMLTGIGRYREMYFCFDTLIENEQFESLLGRFDEDVSSSLQQAILGYLREYCEPNKGKELFKLAVLKFKKYKDEAEMLEHDVNDILNNIFNTMHIADDSMYGTTKLRCTPTVLNLLKQCLENTIHATESYLLDNKVLLAQKSAYKAELIAMQIDLVSRALDSPNTPSGQSICFCVIQLKAIQQIKNLINHELRVSQSLILSRAYNFDINWAEALLSQYVIQLKSYYLRDLIEQVDITDDIIENVVKGFQLYTQHHEISKQMDENITEIVEMVSSVVLKYKLASLLTLKSTILSLINGSSIHFLRDMKFGRREENRNN